MKLFQFLPTGSKPTQLKAALNQRGHWSLKASTKKVTLLIELSHDEFQALLHWLEIPKDINATNYLIDLD